MPKQFLVVSEMQVTNPGCTVTHPNDCAPIVLLHSGPGVSYLVSNQPRLLVFLTGTYHGVDCMLWGGLSGTGWVQAHDTVILSIKL